MNTLTIDQAVYDGAALYARQNNMSVQKVIELGVKLLLTNVRHSNTKANDMELEEALKYVSTLSAKGGRTVPVDENGRRCKGGFSCDWKDYEDAVQHMSAIKIKADCMVTRNKKDFRKSVIPVYTIDELMSLM